MKKIGVILCGLMLTASTLAENGASAVVGTVGADTRVGADAGALVTAPTAEIIYTVTTREKEMPKSFCVGSGFEKIGDYLYISTGGDRRGGGTVQCFKWNPQSESNKIVYVDSVANSILKGGLFLCATSGRLYGLGHYVGGAGLDDKIYNGLAWYDIDKETGKPIEKGVLKDIVAGGGGMITGPEGKDLYFFHAGNQLCWMKIGDDGTPTKSGLVAGAGVGSPRMSPDGKNIYSIRDNMIGIVDRRPTGEVAYRKAISLDSLVNKKTPGVVAMEDLQPTVAGISPDGQWLYVEIFSSQARTRWFFGIFKRDPGTGDLAFQEGGSDYDVAYNKTATLPGMNLIFAPDGKGGYITTVGDLVQSFRYDSKTGHLTEISNVIAPVERLRPYPNVVYDPKNNLMFGGGWWQHGIYGEHRLGLWVAKTGSAQVCKDGRLDIKSTSAAAGAKVTNTNDWPCWRGSNGDGKSLLKGIRKDWAGGLKEVWRVSGLSPGPSTWSAPSVKGDKLVILGKHGWMDEAFCFDADKGGAPLWIAELPGGNGGDGWSGGPSATPYVDKDMVFLSQSNRYVCLSLADGKVLWKRDAFDTGHSPGHSPLVWEDLVILPNVIVPETGKRIQLAALKKDTGEFAWGYETPLDSSGYVSPLLLKINGTDQIVYSANSFACGLEPRTGKPIWNYQPDGKNISCGGAACNAPMTDGSTVIVTTVFRAPQYAKIPAICHPDGLKIENGVAKFVWNGDYGVIWSDSILKGGYVYTFTPDGLYSGGRSNFRCVDTKTGVSKWVQSNTGCGTLIEVDGCLLCLNYYGNDLWLTEPSPDGFKKITEWKLPIPTEKWWPPGDYSTQPFWTVPVVARGKLYVRYNDLLVCYDLMHQGPYVDRTVVAKDNVTFVFEQAEGGLSVKDSTDGSIQGLTLTDTSGSSKPAKARIEGSSLIVDFKDGDFPVKIEYKASGNLCSKGGPSRSFEWDTPRLQFQYCWATTIELKLDRPVDQDVWMSVKTYMVSGANVTNVEVVRSDNHALRLTTDRSWKAGDKVTVKYPALPMELPGVMAELTFTVPDRSARFVKIDEATAGSWKGNYGAEEAVIAGVAPVAAPKYAVVKNYQNHTWVASTDDARALQTSAAAKDRILACWSSSSAFDIDIELPADGKEHQVALYCLAWGNGAREMTVEIRDPVTHAVLDSRVVQGYGNGKYIVWNIRGHVTLHLINTGAENAVVSGIFFDATARTDK
jgi:hypothetical protein